MTGREYRRAVGGRREVAEAIRAGVAVEIRVSSSVADRRGMREVLAEARAANVPVRSAERGELDALARDHRGVVAVVRTGSLTIGEADLATWPWSEDSFVVVLDGVSDPQNLGAAARTAEAAGAAMLVSRVRRAAPVSGAAISASSGALLHLPHARVANIGRAIQRLQATGFVAIGLDGHAPTTVYEHSCPSGRVALVVGNEEVGISRLVRERCDRLVCLPMAGRVASLNASAALAAALYAYVMPTRISASPG